MLIDVYLNQEKIVDIIGEGFLTIEISLLNHKDSVYAKEILDKITHLYKNSTVVQDLLA
jgi:hypothetical protein